ncbi:MAG: hypothetical protein OEV94_04860 [Deltaproteobacteria bacterium]|nr:hypothetical protein [Deltaproteobacteria bacterium]
MVISLRSPSISLPGFLCKKLIHGLIFVVGVTMHQVNQTGRFLAYPAGRALFFKGFNHGLQYLENLLMAIPMGVSQGVSSGPHDFFFCLKVTGQLGEQPMNRAAHRTYSMTRLKRLLKVMYFMKELNMILLNARCGFLHV